MGFCLCQPLTCQCEFLKWIFCDFSFVSKRFYSSINLLVKIAVVAFKWKERREWTHACSIVGRAYFLAGFSCSHLPLAEKHFIIRGSSGRLVRKTSSLSYPSAWGRFSVSVSLPLPPPLPPYSSSVLADLFSSFSKASFVCSDFIQSLL